MKRTLLALAVALVAYFATTSARADQPVPATPQLGFVIGTYTTCQPATAAGIQLNLKTNSWQRFSFLQGFGCTYRGWAQPVGLAGYVGYAAASDGTSGYQAALLVSYADFVAAGPGTQTFLDPTTGERFWQATINLVGNFAWGSSVTKLGESMRASRAEGARK